MPKIPAKSVSSIVAEAPPKQNRSNHAGSKPKARSVSSRSPEVPWRDLHAEAAARFHVKRFRPGQREVLEAIFAGRDVLALMPTGAGKSLCYQLPALFLPQAVVVVSPLLALMQDQRCKAEEANIAVEKVDSTLSTVEEREALAAIDQGISQLVYVTPERLENREFLDRLCHGGVSLMAIDEAHCISQWGHDFRPAYMGLKYARGKLGNPPVVALTATATDEVVVDILKQLGAEDAVVVNTGTERPNLSFAVHPTVNANAKQCRLLAMIKEESGTGIVYTASVRTASELHDWLAEQGVSVARYHGKMRAKERAVVQESFMRGETKVLIATKAFGMGIDKPDIRFVFHYEFPDSLESYYQEAGRAGRDGEPARAVLLYRLEDRRIQKFFLVGRYPRVEELRAVIEAMRPEPALTAGTAESEAGKTKAAKPVPVSPGAVAERSGVGQRRVQGILYLLREADLVRRGARGYTVKAEGVSDAALEQMLAAFAERGESDRKRLDEMMHYAESPVCRKQLLRRYFGEEDGDACGTCDNCQGVHDPGAEIVPCRHEEVVEVMTAVGEVVTTAPETLPVRPQGPVYAKGDQLQHRNFGPGRVLDVDGYNLMVRFERVGVKKVRITFVRKA